MLSPRRPAPRALGAPIVAPSCAARRARAAFATFLLLAACARPAPPDLAPVEVLRVGLDPGPEAERAARRFAEGGRVVHRRIAGKDVAAFAARDARAGRTFVRIYTTRGLAFAMDAPSEHHRVAHIDLLEVPRAGEDHDLDGDGSAELVLASRDEARGRRCLALIRVDGRGALREVALPLGAFGGTGCVEGLADLAGGPALEALALVRYPALSVGRPPAVPVMFGGGAAWGPVPPGAARPYYAAQDAERVAALGAAETFAERHRLAVERAGLARVQGAPAEAQVARYLESLGPVDPSRRARVAATRDFIEGGWRLPDAEEPPAEVGRPRVIAPAD
ncbi:MAG: hypothetical protein AAGH15_25070 [Myxococcota bacterium]